MKNLLLLPILFTLICCSKEDDPAPISDELLAGASSKTWIITDFKSAGVADFKDQPVCVQDDLWVFFATGEMEQNEGASKCQPSDPQVYAEGSWVLFPESNTLRLTRSTIVNFNVVTLTKNEMTLTSGSDKYYFSSL
ncbi:MAG: hypothetical protein JNM78_19835 [Cyclobacteriaceae bacterium]|nr:hypothetical protein [Cyclobacteriaceae bacterium]